MSELLNRRRKVVQYSIKREIYLLEEALPKYLYLVSKRQCLDRVIILRIKEIYKNHCS